VSLAGTCMHGSGGHNCRPGWHSARYVTRYVTRYTFLGCAAGRRAFRQSGSLRGSCSAVASPLCSKRTNLSKTNDVCILQQHDVVALQTFTQGAFNPFRRQQRMKKFGTVPGVIPISSFKYVFAHMKRRCLQSAWSQHFSGVPLAAGAAIECWA
jgi:hypothetical protein